MIKLIYGVALLVVFMVVGMSVANAAAPTKRAQVLKQIEKFAHQHDADQPQAKTNAVRAKTEAGLDKMCLALDIREIRMIIEEALIDPQFEEYAFEGINRLLFHLEGTAEGERLWKLLDNENATIYDYQNTVNEVERSLQTRLKGEEHWAFKLGGTMLDVFMATSYGTEADVQTALTELQVLANEAPKYVSDEEAQLLRGIASYAYVDGLTYDDLMWLELNLEYFFAIYFDEA